MPTLLPTTKDVRRVRKQAEAGITVTLDAVKNPLFAVLGAVDAATQSVTGTLGKARSEATSRPEPTELRKLAVTCSEAMQKAYCSLVERGEEVFDEFRSQPRVKQALDSVESGVDTAQERLEVVVRDLNVAAADLRSRFARTSRSVGEKVALDTERATTVVAQQVRKAADEVSETVIEAGEEAATATRSVTRRAANQASPPRKPATRQSDGTNTSQP
jgi:heparin binding hemagglutinin HbhA